MNVIYNNHPLELPSNDMSVAELIKWKGISTMAMAIAVNNKVVSRNEWPLHKLQEDDKIVVINAAFGG